MPEYPVIPIDAVIRYLHMQSGPSDPNRFACPICSDRKRRLYIHRGKNVYHCFHCGSGGGPVDLYSQAVLGRELSAGDSAAFTRVYREMCGIFLDGNSAALSAPSVPAVPERLPADDRNLDAAYRSVLDFPEFALSEADCRNLLARGLTPQAVRENGYRTVAEDFGWTRKPEYQPHVVEYENRHILDRQRELGLRQSRECLLAGYLVARRLEQKGIDPEGVPGFYRVDGSWCLKLIPGLVIPVRSLERRIVGLQVRTGKPGRKYLTLSAGGLPDAVSTGICRTHVPLQCPAPAADTKVLITEGPLKADAAVCLGDGTAEVFLAIAGINNTRDLRENVVPKLLGCGIHTVYNALDMDRVTNENVARGSRKLCDGLRSRGLKVMQMYWDMDWARSRIPCLQAQLAAADPSQKPKAFRCPDVTSAALRLYELTRALKAQGIDRTHWRAETKGVDDYRLYRKNAQNVDKK